MTSSRISGVAEAIMTRAKHYALELTRGELETVRALLEAATSGASAAQLQALEVIDGRIYAILYPELLAHGPSPHASGCTRLARATLVFFGLFAA